MYPAIQLQDWFKDPKAPAVLFCFRFHLLSCTDLPSIFLNQKNLIQIDGEHRTGLSTFSLDETKSDLKTWQTVLNDCPVKYLTPPLLHSQITVFIFAILLGPEGLHWQVLRTGQLLNSLHLQSGELLPFLTVNEQAVLHLFTDWSQSRAGQVSAEIWFPSGPKPVLWHTGEDDSSQAKGWCCHHIATSVTNPVNLPESWPQMQLQKPPSRDWKTCPFFPKHYLTVCKKHRYSYLVSLIFHQKVWKYAFSWLH